MSKSEKKKISSKQTDDRDNDRTEKTPDDVPVEKVCRTFEDTVHVLLFV
jgi:hypothetical protein